MMFPITLLTCIGGLTGHIVYGLTLGLIFRKKKVPSRFEINREEKEQVSVDFKLIHQERDLK